MAESKTAGTKMDKETERAWHGWVVFTKWITWASVAVATLLLLMLGLLY
jgi:hypothetical protein